MFIIVQPASDKKTKVPIRLEVGQISEYRNYPENSDTKKALITFHKHTGKDQMIVLCTAEEIDEQIKNNAIKPK